MADYDFSGLSPHDLELLARDLLQAEHGIAYESFARGRDSGIDLRHRKQLSRTIVQCKHYPHNDWHALRRALNNEIPKVQELRPSRYIVVTSMSLSVRRKDEIATMFSPYCQGSHDVIGREDINNLLGKHPAVERGHYKLWLTSVTVLTRVLNSQMYSDQQDELNHIKRRVSRFVRNPSFDRASDILGENNFVVIAGVPGIGKSTLAEMLVLDHLDRGYEPFRLWESIQEAQSVLQRRERQLFYFDDFLGRTGLRHTVRRNEDERLVRFVREISRSPNTRLILTTREYILNQARAFMEALAADDIEIAKCVVDLSDYAKRIRAEILYNHLYFSDLPASHLSELVGQKAYRDIVRHPNYNPRILEAMTDALNVRTIQAESYPQHFVAALDNPRHIWQIAFREHLTLASQSLLLVLATLGDRVTIAHAEHAFDHFHSSRSVKYGTPRTPYDWQRALKELDGNFISTEASQGQLVLEFHNPSIRDFLEHHLRDNAQDVLDLISSSVFSKQVVELWSIARKRGTALAVDDSLAAPLASRYWQLRDSEAIGLTQRFDGRLFVRPESVVDRFLMLWDITMSANQERPTEVLAEAIGAITEKVLQGPVNREEMVGILERCIAAGPDSRFGRESALFKVVVEESFQFNDFVQLDEFAALAVYVDEYHDAVTDDHRERLVEAFVDFSAGEEDEIRESRNVDSFETLLETATILGVEIELVREEIEDDYYDPDDRYEGGMRTSSRDDRITDAGLDRMFSSLIDGKT